MPSFPVSHLPDLCLLAIFRYVPLKDVIRTVGCVCKNWARVQRDELRLCRRTLALLCQPWQQRLFKYFGSCELRFDLIEHIRRDDGSPLVVQSLRTLDHIRLHTLQMRGGELRESFCSPLMNLLSSITHLAVIQEEYSSTSVLVQITRMINHFNVSLVCLTVFYTNISASEQESNTNPEMTAFFGSINCLRALSHLELNFDHSHSLSTVPRMSILSKLSYFWFGSQEKCLQFFIDSIRQYAGDGLSIDCGSYLKLSDTIMLNDGQLANKFSQFFLLKDKLTVSHYNQMKFFSGRFSSLVFLGLRIDSMPLTMIARCLSVLKKLIHLKLHIGFIPDEEEEQQMHQLAQISSVQSLTLYICTQSHLDTERLHIAEIFPQLQVLHLHHTISNCRSCDYLERHYNNYTRLDYDKLMAEYGPRIAECMRLARQPFRRCSNLHTIQYETRQVYLNRLIPHGLITVDQL